jgi:hypothetical protein
MAALALGACTSDDSDPSPSPSSKLATSVGSIAAYCEIQGLRQMIADGEVQQSQLPDFADMTEVNGTPLILDFKKPGTESSAAFVDRLFASPGLQGVEVDLGDRDKCADTTTDADIEKSQGGPGYLAATS